MLTAFEIARLDLWGTKLVVLSACDTGLGEVRRGDGVYGLRRAFVLAGVESQVMSLWPVSDRGTRDLMVSYYKSLMGGAGRGEALRAAQLQLFHSKARSPRTTGPASSRRASGQIDDRRLFEEVVRVENELVDGYARGLFPSPTRERFEQNYLAHLARRERALFAEALAAKIDRTNEVAATVPERARTS